MASTQAVVAKASTALADLPLRVLYFNPNSTHENGKEAISKRGHGIVCAATAADGLNLLLEHTFDAVVIESKEEDLEVIDFTIKVNRMCPDLPVFLTSDWGPDLPMALEDVVNGAFAIH